MSTVSVKIDTFTFDDFTGTLDEVLAQLERLREDYSEYTTLRFYEDFQYGGGYGNTDYPILVLIGERAETAEEVQQRLELERKRKDKEQRELIRKEKEQLAKLLKKYGTPPTDHE